MSDKPEIALLKQADAAYYNGSNPIMSDEQYDLLEQQAKEKYPSDPYHRQIGAAPDSSGPWVVHKHAIPMGSIENIPIDDRKQWIPEVLKNTAVWLERHDWERYYIQPKLDGLSINLECVSGFVCKALVRGDCYEGEDILRNVQKMTGFPKTVPENVTNIRCELVMKRNRFAELNALLLAAGEKPYANSRSAAAGIARRFDGKYAEFVDVIAFKVYTTAGINEPMYDHELLPATFGSRKYTVPCVLGSGRDFEAYYKRFEQRTRYAYPYPTDGLIIKLGSNDTQQAGDPMLPDGMRALKFPPESKLFTVDKILVDVGKTGRLTPVLYNKEGVQFADKKVTTVTAHNYGELHRLGIAVGCVVRVSISMDVIPYVEGVETPATGAVPETPTHCPECGAVVRFEDPYVMCVNTECPGILRQRLLAYAVVTGMDGIGPGIVKDLFDAGLVKYPADYYTLNEMQLSAAYSKYSGLSGQNILQAIDLGRSMPLSKFVAALSIPEIGAKVIDKIDPESIAQLQAMTEAELVRIPGIGQITATTIVTGLKERQQIIAGLLSHVTVIGRAPVEKLSDKLVGQSFCFTGDAVEFNPSTGRPYSRDDLSELVVKNGGVVKTGVSKKLTTLVMSDLSFVSTKATKAKALGIRIITVSQFLTEVGGLMV